MCEEVPTCFLAVRIGVLASKKRGERIHFLAPIIRGILARSPYPVCKFPKLVPNSREGWEEQEKEEPTIFPLPHIYESV